MRDWVRAHPVISQYILAVAISWGYWLALLSQGIRTGAGSAYTHFPGLLGPLLGALIVAGIAEGWTGLAVFLRRMVQIPKRPGLMLLAVVLAPLATAVILLAGIWSGGEAGTAEDYLTYPGIAAGTPIVLTFVLALVVNGYGEEAGWRGFVFDRLLPRFGGFGAVLIVIPLWAVWHLPLFWLHQPLADMVGPALIGWLFGLSLGAFVLSHLYLASGRSILVVALWHTAYNFAVAVPAATGTPAAIVSTGVMVWGVFAAWRLWQVKVG